MYKVITKIITWISCKVLFKVKYENLQNLKEFDKCLICPNHSRIFDPAFIKPVVSDLYCVAKSDLYKNKIVKKFLEENRTLPINREKADISGVKNIVELLNSKEKIKLLIFPEGRVIKNKQERGKIKSGAIHIAATVDIPIIPVYITARPKFFSKVIVKIGKPFFPKKEVLNEKRILKEETTRLLNEIYSLE